MDFSQITNMNAYTKALNLKNQWQQNMDNPNQGNPTKGAALGMLTSSMDPAQNAEAEKGSKVAAIVQKYQSGQDLSAEELEYLRQNSPETYKDLMKDLAESRAYAKALENCETKEDVRALHMSKVSQAFSQAKDAIERNDLALSMKVNARMNMMAKVLADFAATKEYGELAEDHTELEAAREAEKAEAQPPQEVEGERPVEETQPPEAAEEPTSETTGEAAGENAESSRGADRPAFRRAPEKTGVRTHELAGNAAKARPPRTAENDIETEPARRQRTKPAAKAFAQPAPDVSGLMLYTSV